VSVGASHAAALSAGGDCFMWGVGTYGRLGFGHLRPVPVPTLLIGGLPKDTNTVRGLVHEGGEVEASHFSYMGEVFR
jgi:hypothetical protein